MMDLCSLYYEFLGGILTYPMFDAPFLATSVRDFWGKRWNLPVAHYFKEFVFGRLRGCGMSGLWAALLVFLVSGVAHEVFMMFVGDVAYKGWAMGFFLVHGVLCVVESFIPGEIKEVVPRGVSIVLCQAIMVITCPLFCMPLHNIYSPIFNIRH
uniref:Wax synthase domain-containing protein n=1 Tax=Arcella intermedia TaxID=1963864 RepID=A0A6B2LIN4_9EUKA